MRRARQNALPRHLERPDEVATTGGLRLAGLTGVILVFAEAVAPSLLPSLVHGSPLVAGLLFVTAHLVAMAWVLFHGRYSRTLLVASAVPLAVGIALVLPDRSSMDPINLWAPATGRSPGWWTPSSPCAAASTCGWRWPCRASWPSPTSPSSTRSARR